MSDTQESTKAHRPRIVGLTVLLMCQDCGVELPINYICPICRWEQYFSDDGQHVQEVCIPCFLHGG